MITRHLVALTLSLCGLSLSPALLAQIQRPSAVVIMSPPRFVPAPVVAPIPATADSASAMSALTAVDDFAELAQIAALQPLRTRLIEQLERAWGALPATSALRPEVLLRLSELYADAAALRAIDHDGEPVDYRCAILALRGVVTEFPAFQHRAFALERLGDRLREMGHGDEALAAYHALVCPSLGRYGEHGGFDLSAPLPDAGPALCPRFEAAVRATHPRWITPAAAPARAVITYAHCDAPNGSTAPPPARAGEVWYAIGEERFDNARDDVGRALAVAAYQHAIARNPPAPFSELARYKLAWTFARMTNRQPEAIRGFSALLDRHEDPARVTFAGDTGLRAEAVQWIATILLDEDWGALHAPDTRSCQRVVRSLGHVPLAARGPFQCAGIVRVQSPLFDLRRPWIPELWLALANEYRDAGQGCEAVAMYELFVTRFATHARVAEARAAQVSAAARCGRP